MKNHVLRPLWVVIAAVGLLLLVRAYMVPDDFGVHGSGFTYGFHRLGNIDDWKAEKVQYKGKEYCAECHEENVAANNASKHNIIQCENCHGPAMDHPDNPEKLEIDRSRDLCLRCHALLPYPDSARGRLKGINPQDHNPDSPCAECHNPHKPALEDM
ncbi:MAG: cytochrome c3 family protein [Proteobacteria bacterium]|nr:cytochrome c3 family protein [Pseudomonadota bacterium]MBU1738040.1 cytochrome c3 family protein [Pseudomonadota bacterium]